jgi:hypothetical protein
MRADERGGIDDAAPARPMEGTVTAGMLDMLGIRGIACAGAEAAPATVGDVGDAGDEGDDGDEGDAVLRGRWLGRLLWIAFA